MPDMKRPVQAVSKAVANLAEVGREMINTTEDCILRQVMLVSINKLENAAMLLVAAAAGDEDCQCGYQDKMQSVMIMNWDERDWKGGREVTALPKDADHLRRLAWGCG